MNPIRYARRIARRSLDRALPTMMGIAVKNGLLSNLWYVFDQAFVREHRGVLAGHLRYRRDESSGKNYLLRRNTHRLEKGLISRPRRDVFAREYILETVEAFEWLVTQTPCADNASKLLASWASDVLSRYFDVTGSHPILDEARGRFVKARAAFEQQDEGRAPYKRDLSPLPVTIEHMLELAHRRRSVRWYEQKPVPREVIDKAAQVAMYSPSACNRQPFEFRIFDEPELVRKIATIPGGTRGFDHNFPCMCVIIGQLSAYPRPRDRHLIYIDASLAAMAFEFALEVQGVATCSINWPDVPSAEAAMRTALNLSADQRVVMCMSLGYPDPDGLVPYSQKKSIDEFRRYNATC